MSDLEVMAERMREAAKEPIPFADRLAEFFADEVYVRHDPPMSADGPTTGAHVGKLHREETRVWVQRIPDYHHENVSVWTEGGDLRMALDLVGTMPSGAVFRVPTVYRMKIREGRIYDAELAADAEASKPMMELVVEDEIPVELIWNPFADEK